MRRSLLMLVILLALFSTALSGCKPAPPLVILASGQPGSADPAENWTGGGAAYLPHVYESLYVFEGDVAPGMIRGLAYNFPEVSSDNLVYTIYLKPDLTFHDGTPITSEAVIYSYERIKALNKGPNTIAAEYIASMSAEDDYAITIVLKEPYADFVNSMASLWGNYIINPKLCKENEVNGDWCQAWIQTHDAGSGPYTLANIDTAANTITLQRHEKWWKKWENKSAPNQVIIRWLSDPAQARSLLESGEADIAMHLPPEDFAALGKAGGFTNSRNAGMTQYALVLNGSAAPLDNKLVRQALQYSFNAEKAIEDVFAGDLFQMDSAIGPGYSTLYKASVKYSFDLDKAKALLAEAGHADGLELTVNVLGQWPNDQALLEFWQADLATIGVQLTITPMDRAAWSETWLGCQAAGGGNIGQIAAVAVTNNYPSTWQLLAQVYPTPRVGGDCSMTYLDNPVINEGMAELLTITNSAERKEVFETLIDAMAEDASVIWVGQAADTITISNAVKGYRYSFSMGGNYVPLSILTVSK